MTKAFFGAWGGALRDGWYMATVLPLLLAAMVGVEFAQHVVEIKLGFFSVDPAVRQAASLAPLRMVFGWPKMIVVYALGFFALRYFVTADPRATVHPPWRAVRRYAWVAGYQLVIAAVVVYAAPILALLGFGAPGVLPLRLVMGLTQQFVEPALFLWFVNAATGTRAYGPVASARTTGWMYFWALLLMFAARLPFNAAHQVLNRWPAGQPATILWPALALDPLVVAAMVTVLAALQVRIARFIAARRGVDLLREQTVA